MNLPPQPKLEDFPGQECGYSHTMYQAALAAWERVCLSIIHKEEQDALLTHLSNLNDGV